MKPEEILRCTVTSLLRNSQKKKLFTTSCQLLQPKLYWKKLVNISKTQKNLLLMMLWIFTTLGPMVK
jgi:hypothetical protein